MELADLLLDIRDELDDEAVPPLWSDEKLVRYLNEALDEAAVRARLLVESVDPEICSIALVPGQASYPLHGAIILIRRAALASRPSECLLRTTTAALDDNCSNWRTQPGRPEFVVVDQQGSGKTLLVSPVPTVADTLQLTVLRYPTEAERFEPGDTDSEPPFDAAHHRKLVHWACFRALNKRDVEQQSTADADRHLQLFEAHFGPKPSARQLQQLAIDPIVGSAPNWF